MRSREIAAKTIAPVWSTLSLDLTRVQLLDRIDRFWTRRQQEPFRFQAEALHVESPGKFSDFLRTHLQRVINGRTISQINENESQLL